MRMQVDAGSKARAHGALADVQAAERAQALLRQRLRRQARRGARARPTASRRSRSCAAQARRSAIAGWPTWTPGCLVSRRRRPGAAFKVLWGEGRRRDPPPRARDLRPPRREEGDQVEVDGVGGGGAGRGARGERRHADTRETRPAASTSSQLAQGTAFARIISQAIHKDKEQVSDLFAERPGRPRLTDTAALRREAPDVLYAHFLSADLRHLGRRIHHRRNQLGGDRHQRGQRPDGDRAAEGSTSRSPASRR